VIARTLKDGLEAERTHFATFEGKFTDERKTPDNSARLKATELLGKFKGYIVERHEVKADGEITFSIQTRHPRPAEGADEDRD